MRRRPRTVLHNRYTIQLPLSEKTRELNSMNASTFCCGKTPLVEPGGFNLYLVFQLAPGVKHEGALAPECAPSPPIYRHAHKVISYAAINPE
jgi:hypothetical protein